MTAERTAIVILATLVAVLAWATSCGWERAAFEARSAELARDILRASRETRRALADLLAGR